MAKPDQSRYPRERIPPGQFVTEKFPILHAGSVPRFDRTKWDFRVYGAVENPIQVSYDALRAMPTKEVLVDIHCVTTWSKLDTRFTGVPTRHILDVAKPASDAKYVVAECEEGYTANVLRADLEKETVLLAWGYGGADLTPEHGFPLRLLVPHRYFWKSAKWLRALRFVTDDEPGFWEVRGYHNNADYWGEERYSFEGDQTLRPMPAQGEDGNPGPGG
ncbi:MAG TPA: sulfite oxidase-like oxidoreductase [Candidatus Thermoplasmatota archaeon]|nr:sulfite oxidase-like oxidoreductase [Candidatus Thermoplasmatota archaeon]